MENLQAYIDAAQQAVSAEDIQRLCEMLSDDYDYDFFQYALIRSTTYESPQIHVISSYPAMWFDRYIEHDYLLVDPLLKHCMTQVTSIQWYAAVAQTNSKKGL